MISLLFACVFNNERYFRWLLCLLKEITFLLTQFLLGLDHRRHTISVLGEVLKEEEHAIRDQPLDQTTKQNITPLDRYAPLTLLFSKATPPLWFHTRQCVYYIGDNTLPEQIIRLITVLERKWSNRKWRHWLEHLHTNCCKGVKAKGRITFREEGRE